MVGSDGWNACGCTLGSPSLISIQKYFKLYIISSCRVLSLYYSPHSGPQSCYSVLFSWLIWKMLHLRLDYIARLVGCRQVNLLGLLGLYVALRFMFLVRMNGMVRIVIPLAPVFPLWILKSWRQNRLGVGADHSQLFFVIFRTWAQCPSSIWLRSIRCLKVGGVCSSTCSWDCAEFHPGDF